MTGTKDVAPIGGADVESRLAVFPALPPGGKYELVLDGAEHSAFTDRALPGDSAPRNPNHHRAILALSTAFWDAWLRGDAAARQLARRRRPALGAREGRPLAEEVIPRGRAALSRYSRPPCPPRTSRRASSAA